MTPQSRPLIEVLADIPDFWTNRGKRHPLATLLALACSTIRWGDRSYTAMTKWGRRGATGMSQVSIKVREVRLRY
jgi:hypothetical protein